ncbi:MAG TPA: NAD(P)(+) transhydrogenase (Re/Si-specific) subunit beta [Candidatus Hydrogenedentes bacterium]|nr:NAD(P)(+) transhydrogenase (Re/Si-specific) subunit beta [Candidatus Hydrogenedentota bacterium]
MQNLDAVIQIAYIVSAILFILGLKMMSKIPTAAKGNLISAVGMLIAIVATLLYKFKFPEMGFVTIGAGLLVGSLIGAVAAARVPMTSMPEFVALFNGSGGLASMLVGVAEYYKLVNNPEHAMGFIALLATYLAILIGGVTFTGSVIAYAKLAEKINGKPILFKGQQVVNGLVLAILLLAAVAFLLDPLTPAAKAAFICASILSLVLGVLVTIPIGGADMPVVISLLNSYSGLAACAAGFVISNTVLIVAGSLVGASGIILTNIMCKAMNRSLTNVLFSGFGASTVGAGKAVQGEVKALSVEDAYYVLEAASSVVFVPGYGMAVAQAQHAVRELGELLEKNGAEVKYAIHPVAGRMPGHMNVLLAEANVPYEQLVEMDDINPIIETVDVCVVIGANDVVNPAAREDETSPIYGMPIINVDKAKTCFVIKRSMRSGFAGIENPLFYKENTRMIFGDAKAVITGLIEQFKE